MAVGRIRVSPVAMVGNISGSPPACHTPRLTASATSVRCALQGASSEALVAMPMTGRPSNTSCPKPWLRIQERYSMPLRPRAPNQAWLRRLFSRPSVMCTLPWLWRRPLREGALPGGGPEAVPCHAIIE